MVWKTRSYLNQVVQPIGSNGSRVTLSGFFHVPEVRAEFVFEANGCVARVLRQVPVGGGSRSRG